MLSFTVSALALSTPVVEEVARARPSEVLSREDGEALGVVWRGNHTVSPLPHETMKTEDLPDAFDWCSKGMCTMSRNQHIPQCTRSAIELGVLAASD